MYNNVFYSYVQPSQIETYKNMYEHTSSQYHSSIDRCSTIMKVIVTQTQMQKNTSYMFVLNFLEPNFFHLSQIINNLHGNRNVVANWLEQGSNTPELWSCPIHGGETPRQQTIDY